MPEKDLVIGLPYLGNLPLQIRTRINRIMKNKLPYCNIRFVFQTKCKISNFFTFKDKFYHSYVLALFTNFSVAAAVLSFMPKLSVILMCEHLGSSALTGKRVEGDDDSTTKEHLLFCNHTPDFKDFLILATNNNVALMDSLLINRDHPSLNNKQSLPSELFDN